MIWTRAGGPSSRSILTGRNCLTTHATVLRWGERLGQVKTEPASARARNGASWSGLGLGLGGAGVPRVLALTVFDDGSGRALYAGGDFTTAGGVSANKSLKAEFARRAETPVRVPPLVLCTDNAAMIAAAGNFRFLAGQRDGLGIDALPNWRLV